MQLLTWRQRIHISLKQDEQTILLFHRLNVHVEQMPSENGRESVNYLCQKRNWINILSELN